MCHCCRAMKPNFFSAPAELGSKFRHSTETFLAECVKRDPARYLFGLMTFSCIFLVGDWHYWQENYSSCLDWCGNSSSVRSFAPTLQVSIGYDSLGWDAYSQFGSWSLDNSISSEKNATIRSCLWRAANERSWPTFDSLWPFQRLVQKEQGLAPYLCQNILLTAIVFVYKLCQQWNYIVLFLVVGSVV